MVEVGNRMMTESAVESAADLFLDVKPSISVLFVDDEPAFSAVVKQCLELLGSLCVDTATSADEAIEKMKEKKYDVIVSDHLMPGKDGLQLLKELREEGKNTPFLLLIGEDLEEIAIKALKSDAIYFFKKFDLLETGYGELADRIFEVAEVMREEKSLLTSEENVRGIFSNTFDSLARLIHKRPMRWSEALIFASIFSYVAAAATTLVGYPSQDPGLYSSSLQIAFYLTMPLLLVLSQSYRPLRVVLAGVYGVVAMLSFSGLQRWVNYNGDSSLLGPAMSVWDLTLAVALLDDY
jgi:CheY-like chemotaxis protein